MRKKSSIERRWEDRKKVLKAAIRLKHALAADEEINETLPVEHKDFFKGVHQGKERAALSPAKAQEAVGVRS